MATFRFELNNTPTRNKKYSIFLCVTVDGKRKRLKTGVELYKKSDFNPKCRGDNWVRASDPNHKVLNEALSKELESAKLAYRDLKDSGHVSSEKIKKQIVSTEKSESFLQYARERTKQIYDSGGYRNYKKYNSFLNKLEDFLKKDNGTIGDLLFTDITSNLLSKFQNYLITVPNKRVNNKQLHKNTIEVNLNVFKTLVKRAIEVEGLMKSDLNPFIRFSYKGVRTEKEKLDLSEIRAIEALELEEGSLIWHCRNCFLFSFYCAGIRAGDLLQLRWCNITSEGRLNYQMGKNHKIRDLVLVDQAKKILEYYYTEKSKHTDYIFPFMDPGKKYSEAVTQADIDTLPTLLKVRLLSDVSSKNAILNKYLKQIGERAGIQKSISMHMARHSFAKVAKQQGIDNALLKDLLGHSSLNITEGYMGAFDTAVNDAALASIFKKPNGDQMKDAIDLLKGLSPEEIVLLISQIKGQK